MIFSQQWYDELEIAKARLEEAKEKQKEYYDRNTKGQSIPTSTDISIGYPIDVSADPVGYPSWMSYGCLQDILMSSPMDVKRVYP